MKEIKLTQGKVAIVDDEDYEWLNQWKWKHVKGYALRTLKKSEDGERRGVVTMHRVIASENQELSRGAVVVHADKDGLNNQRLNISVKRASPVILPINREVHITQKAIELTRGLVAIVNDKEFERLNGFKWFAACVNDKWYAVRASSAGRLHMHREVVRIADRDMNVVHRDGDTLNNTLENLRIGYNSESKVHASKPKRKTGAASKYKGVTRHKQAGKWVAQIKINGKQNYLGYFDTEEEAAIAYDTVALKKFYEFANPNILPKYKPPNFFPDLSPDADDDSHMM
jgi:hypothetical protein